MMDDAAKIQLLDDIASLSTMELRQKYRGEASTHSNMKARVKTKAAKVHEEFQSFTNFLCIVGPKPNKKATLDRIDNNDPEYAPGKVRWADKQTQNNNKGDSLIFYSMKTGRTYTASQLALKQELTPTAIRKRRSYGWTDDEIIAGYRSATNPVFQPRVQYAARQSLYIPPSAAEIQFMRDRETCEHCRQVEGSEYFISTPAEVQESNKDCGLCQGEDWLRQAEENFFHHKLPKWWKQYKPHIRFNDLLPFQQEWILRIDPCYGNKLAQLADLKLKCL
jgi:hypothetical protein